MTEYVVFFRKHAVFNVLALCLKGKCPGDTCPGRGHVLEPFI